MNPVAEVLTGVESGQAHGNHIDGIVKLIGRDDSLSVSSIIELCRLEGRVKSNGQRVSLQRNDGVEYDVEYHISTIRDELGKTTGMTCLFRDVTTKQNLIKSAQWGATHDPLTNLVNRTEFENRINNLFGKDASEETHHAMCLIDFDQFKLVNESHGIDGGNHVLTSIAVELKQKIRGADTLARVGDDKFGVLLRNCPIDKARLIGEGLRRIVEDF